MQFPKQIQNAIEAFEKLPGIGQKTAARLAFYLLHTPEIEVHKIGEAISNLKKNIFLCDVCKSISEEKVCVICQNHNRSQKQICVVEQPLDIFALEKMGTYDGLYHVLHGVINPLHNIGPEELYIDDLIGRLTASSEPFLEVILAMNPTMEGEATAMYLVKRIRSLQLESGKQIKISRLGVGMPIGGDMQYADETTLTRAMEGRRDY